MPTVTVQMTGQSPEELIAKIPRAVDAAMDAMADKFLRITWENFGTEGQHRPSSWAPLSPPYQRKIKYFGPPKLILSGDLITSIRTLDRSENSFTVGSEVYYASIHQRGGSHGSGVVVPKRPYFPVYDDGGEVELTGYAEHEVNGAALAAMQKIFGQ